MDKTKATVVMPLTEYEKLDRYKDAYNTLIRQIWIAKSDMLELLNGLHYAATSAKEGRISRESLDDQFNLIKDAVSKWEDGEKERPLTG